MSNILDDKAVMTCAHQGTVKPIASNARVTIGGSAALTKADIQPLAGCTLPPAAGGPCTTASFATTATRVTISGLPVLLRNNVALSAPTGAPVSVVLAQPRVTAK